MVRTRQHLGTHADWLWLVDGSAIPRPPALGALLAAAERLGPVTPPIVLASTILDRGGRLAAGHAPLAPQDQTAVAVRTVALRVLHVRAVSGASLLVRADALRSLSLAGPAGAMVWTARLLRGGGGFLVPASLADGRAPVGARERVDTAARLLLGTALRPRERLRLGVGLVEQAGAAVKIGASSEGRP